MMTSQVLRTLEAKELIERRPHPTDARARAVTVTPAGVDLANRANVAVEQVDRDYFGVLGDDRGTFTLMLARLAAQP
jgi:DNA-binding MarR family transcriptional regulator